MTMENLTKRFAWYLENGREMPWRDLPDGIRPARPSHCYQNSARLATRRRSLTYVEGLALCDSCSDETYHWSHVLWRPDISRFARFIVHAWCVDKDGYVVDTTWTQGEHRQRIYIGVPIPTPRLRELIFRKRGYMPYWPAKLE